LHHTVDRQQQEIIISKTAINFKSCVSHSLILIDFKADIFALIQAVQKLIEQFFQSKTTFAMTHLAALRQDRAGTATKMAGPFGTTGYVIIIHAAIFV
jgi:hypothetical protein